MKPTPLRPWVRALLVADRAVHSSVRLAALLRAELLLAALDEDERAAVNAEVFSAEDTYAPGGSAFERGLFEWEREALAHQAFPRGGRVLLGGAGGGRELLALAEMGYAVDAFEPAPTLVHALSAQAARCADSRALNGGYAELVRAARGEGGPLACLRGRGFDGVLLGWASFSHVTSDEGREALLLAIASLAPRAPVLLSYLGPDDDGRLNGRVEALRAPVRAGLSRVFRREAAGEGEGFVPGAGFFRRTRPDELVALAESCGYAVAMHAQEPYPHALLTPCAAASS